MNNSKARISIISLYNKENISIRFMHALLKQHGYQVQLIYFKDNYVNHAPGVETNEIERLIEVLRQFEPDIIGISIGCSALYDIGCELTREVRQSVSALILWGGVHPTVCPEVCIAVADAVCIGEGEIPILTLAKHISAGLEISNIPGLWIRTESGIIRNACSSQPANLDTFPIPDYTDTDKHVIDHHHFQGDPNPAGVWQYLTICSRGCPFRCSFCINSVLPEITPGYEIRRRRVSSVISELEVVKKSFRNVGTILFADEVFTTDSQWIAEFTAEYTEKIRLPFACLVTPRTVDLPILKLLISAGLNEVYMGIQSGSQRVRQEEFARPETDDEIHQAVSIIKGLNLTLNLDVIFDNPFESVTDRQDALELMISLRKPFNLCMFSLAFFPETALTRKALATGQISVSQMNVSVANSVSNWAISLHAQRSKEELFWICIASFAGKMWIPNAMIQFIWQSNFFRRHPQLLIPLVRVNSLISWGIRGVPLLLKGQVPLGLIRKRWRHIVSATK